MVMEGFCWASLYTQFAPTSVQHGARTWRRPGSRRARRRRSAASPPRWRTGRARAGPARPPPRRRPPGTALAADTEQRVSDQSREAVETRNLRRSNWLVARYLSDFNPSSSSTDIMTWGHVKLLLKFIFSHKDGAKIWHFWLQFWGTFHHVLWVQNARTRTLS